MTDNGEEPIGRGVAIVALLSFLEQTMHDVERTLPAVDHLSHPPVRPCPEDRARVVEFLTGSTVAVREAFERWCSSEDAFRTAVSGLEELRIHEKGDPGFEAELTRRIHAVRDARAEVHARAEELRAAVAVEIVSLAPDHSDEATISP